MGLTQAGEEHYHDGNERSEKRKDYEGERLNPRELLSDRVVPERHGHQGCRAESTSGGGHGGGGADDPRGG